MKKLLQRGFGNHPILGVVLTVLNLAGWGWIGYFYQSNIGGGGGTTIVSIGDGYVSPMSFGAKWDVKADTNCTFTNASNTVTCPAGEAQWSSSDLGKIFFGTTSVGALTNGCNGAGCGSVVVPQGFICTINSANSINVGTTYPTCAADNATATCTPGGNTLCNALWGTQDDSTAIQNAAAAAWTATSCKQLEFPSGMAFITIPSGGLLNVTLPIGSPCAGNLISDLTQAGAQVSGQGSSTSVLVPLPSTNFANCTGGTGGRACIAGPPNWFAHDWGIWGFGQANNGLTHNVDLIQFNGSTPGCTSDAFWNMSFNAWDTAATSSQGAVIASGCGVLYISNVVSEGFGNTPCAFTISNGGNLTGNAIDCFGSNGVPAAGGASLLLNLVAGAQYNSTGGFYWGVNPVIGAIAVKLAGTGGVFNSFADVIGGPNEGNNDSALNFSNSSGTITANLSGTKVTQTNNAGAGNAYLIACFSGGNCNVNAFASTLNAIGAKMSMFSTTAGKFKFFDACSNSFTQGTIANTAIDVYGSCSITGTNITAAKLVLSAGWGNTPTAAWTALTGATQSVQGTITNGTVGLAANPTITYTFPTPFLAAPAFCSAYQVGGTQAILAASEFLTPSSLTNTGVVFTFNTTPTASATEVVQILCAN